MTLVPTDAPSFASMGVAEPICRALEHLGITEAFPIQVETIAAASGGRDVIAKGPTGSGKTIAFAVPTVMRLAAEATKAAPRRPRALVLVPTRELATQVAATFSPLAKAVGLRVTTVYGGVGQGPQVRALAAGVDVVVACPGRLEDLIGQRACSLDAVSVTVLDEADHLADLGFLPAVRRLLDRVPADGQRLLFSATIDKAVDAIVRRYLTDPAVHTVGTAAEHEGAMEHHVLYVNPGDKQAVVRALAAGPGRTLLFTRTKRGARKLAGQLTASGVPAVELHGNLAQNARSRNLDAFASGAVTALVATDIAARGIHVDDVGLVVHVDPPAEHKAYLHRSGRTARAGASGTVVTVATPEQRREVAALARAAGVTQRSAEVGPRDPILQALVGGAGSAAQSPAPSAGGRAPKATPAATAAPAPAGAAPAATKTTGNGESSGRRRRRRSAGSTGGTGPSGAPAPKRAPAATAAASTAGPRPDGAGTGRRRSRNRRRRPGAPSTG